MQSAKRNAVWGVGMGRGLLEGVEGQVHMKIRPN